MNSTTEDAQTDYYLARVGRISARIDNELASLSAHGYLSVPGVREYASYLAGRIGRGEYDPTAVRKWDAWGGQREVRTLDPQAYAQQAYRQALQKDFNKLAPFHKVQMFRAYVASLPYSRRALGVEANREEILAQLVQGIDDKMYNKNKTEVSYDGEAGRILNVPSVYIPEDERLYIVDWSRKTAPSV